jgi:hypothetical protein
VRRACRVSIPETTILPPPLLPPVPRRRIASSPFPLADPPTGESQMKKRRCREQMIVRLKLMMMIRHRRQ